MKIIDIIDMTGIISIVNITEYLKANLYVFMRLFLAIILGGIIGMERGQMNRPAGLRTHMIVCSASALIMLLGTYMALENPTIDVTRLGAQVVSGIGFLGAGAILKDGFSVRGLTTAATLWVVACIGLAVGGGFYIGGILTTLLVYLTLKIWGSGSFKAKSEYISMTVDSVDSTIDGAKRILIDAGLHISEIGILETESPNLFEIRFYCMIDKKLKTDSIIMDLTKIKGVKSVYFG